MVTLSGRDLLSVAVAVAALGIGGYLRFSTNELPPQVVVVVAALWFAWLIAESIRLVRSDRPTSRAPYAFLPFILSGAVLAALGFGVALDAEAPVVARIVAPVVLVPAGLAVILIGSVDWMARRIEGDE